MKKTILFDLDGTLLPLDLDIFLKSYLKSISAYFSKQIAPEHFIHHLLKSTEKMVRNSGLQTNEEVFMESFLPPLGLVKDHVYPQFEEYYTTEFCKLRQYTSPSAVSPKILETALANDWQIVLATNPLFPRIAIEERMRWGGIEEYPWKHITSYESSRFCKPNPFYFQEITELLDLEPSECWMVGNDCEEDMVAGKLGFNTFLVTDYLIDKGNKTIEPDRTGSLSELLLLLQTGF